MPQSRLTPLLQSGPRQRLAVHHGSRQSRTPRPREIRQQRRNRRRAHAGTTSRPPPV